MNSHDRLICIQATGIQLFHQRYYVDIVGWNEKGFLRTSMPLNNYLQHKGGSTFSPFLNVWSDLRKLHFHGTDPLGTKTEFEDLVNVTPAKLERTTPDQPLCYGRIPEALIPTMTFTARKLRFYVAPMLMLEALCFPSNSVASHLLSPLGFNTWCMRTISGNKMNIQFLYSPATRERELRAIGFWMECERAYSLMYPVVSSIREGRALEIPKLKQSIELMLRGVRFDNEVFVYAFGKRTHLPYPKGIETIVSTGLAEKFRR